MTRRKSQIAGPPETEAIIFAFFNEIGIIGQLSTTMLAQALPDGVHPSHFSIVNHLVRVGDGRTPAAIAAAMQVTKATMTHSLGVLADIGFVDVMANPADARSKTVHLTHAGRRFREAAIVSVTRRFGPIFKAADQAAMTRLLPELRSIRHLLDANR